MIRTILLKNFRKALNEGRVEALRPILASEPLGEVHVKRLQLITNNFMIFAQVSYFIYDDEVLKIEGTS